MRAPKRRVGEKLAPTELTGAEAAATAEIEENRTEMFAALVERGEAGAGMLETVLNPDSFPQTVENIFALSFMARALALLAPVASLYFQSARVSRLLEVWGALHRSRRQHTCHRTTCVRTAQGARQCQPQMESTAGVASCILSPCLCCCQVAALHPA